MAERDAKGLWKKGQSANPGGRKPVPDDIKLAFREASPGALKTLIEISTDAEAAPAARVSAAATILDRAYGKPTQPISGDADMPPLAFLHEASDEFLMLLAGFAILPTEPLMLPAEAETEE